MILKKHPTIAYYDEKIKPKAVNIISEKLCLNHTFFPKSTQINFTVKDIQNLQESRLIDEMYIFFDNNSLFTKDCIVQDKLNDISGLIDASEFIIQRIGG